MSSKISVIVADDHGVVRAGVRSMLESHADLSVVGDVADGPAAIRMAEDLKPDVAVIDITMPEMSGVEAAKAIRAASPQTRILMLSMHEDQAFVTSSLAAGANGFVFKRAVAEELVTAIRVVHGGRMYVNPATNLHPIERVEPPAELSNREREVLELLAHGYTNNEIAARLSLSDKTIATYRARLSDKLGLKSRADIVRYALESGILHAGRSPEA